MNKKGKKDEKEKGEHGTGRGMKGGEEEEKRRRGGGREEGEGEEEEYFILMNVFKNRLRIRSFSWLSSFTWNTFQSYT